MKLFGLDITRSTKPETRACKESGGNPEYVSSGGNGSLLFGDLFNKYSSMNLSAVYRATELISDSVAVLPVKVKIVDSIHKEEDDTHPLNLIFKDRSGSTISKYNLMKLLIQSVILRGNGFAYIKRSAGGEVVKIQYLDCNDVVINYNKLTDELYYSSTVIKQNRIKPKDMIHLIKNSYDGIHGISVISFATRTLDLAHNTENSAKKFFGKGCNLSGVLKVNGPTSDKQRTDIRNDWNTAYTDGGSGLAILQGNMDYTPIQVNSREAQLLESRVFNVQDIARFFGISPILLGDLTYSGYSTLEAAQQEFLVHTLQPYISMVEGEFSRKLFLPSEDNYEINLDETYLLRTDKTALSSYYSALLQNGVFCVNEVRQELGYSRVSGGDIHTLAYTDVNKSELGDEK